MNSFLYKHCAECGRRIPHTMIRCVEHRLQGYGKASVKTLEVNTNKTGDKAD